MKQIHVSTTAGDDEKGDGTDANPVKSVQRVSILSGSCKV